jgi:lauroyl/myristoyl acyltransferase
MYNMFRFAGMLIPRMPRWLVQALSRVIGVMAWLVASKARKQATINMTHVLGIQVLATRAGRRRLRRTVRGMFQQTLNNYLVAFSLPYLRPETLLRNIHVHDIEHLNAALALGKGVIIFSAHLGPFEHLVHWLALKGYSMTIPVEHLKDERMLDLMLKLRRSHGVNFISLGGSAPIRALFSVLRSNQIVLITADRAVVGESVEKLFFGATARLPTGPALLAQRTGAALVGGFGWYGADTHIEAQFVPLSLELPEEQRRDVALLMDRIVEKMEYFIGAHPEQWVVSSPIWTAPSTTVSVEA